jgi:hypothetical protein
MERILLLAATGAVQRDGEAAGRGESSETPFHENGIKPLAMCLPSDVRTGIQIDISD